ncbi:UDP-N-acetylmuramoyl-L-alanyl-D-glutamate--2,6-diaminopimelate ligase [Cohnella endophytica]|uniref:UDP-N-acetylmuramoyl-L-alanyl-D-glutamate--2,6-diaminopimelate ligase n=1 Tax=Cohnella endophytica TaxID=2419778 RepID=A0A494Y4P3_9BACL|nr:UDP-N-acetylmuramoyl-L-alanyl-D-glutamate--2,6-diaminopimelate ligase [Cohnella endophytica]RKP55266.1 UDP-N-acetylmuramoyl-L-alanyl-D-glutamate--2,6-diaminopimelate ligase [Cohnella endophytica]
MNLAELSQQLLLSRIIGDPSVRVLSLEADSRKAKPGNLFFCLPGHTVDGHDYAPQAVAAGASALVTTRELPLPIAQLVVPDTRQALAVLADYFYGKPSHALRPVGITGTNGKTTTTYLIEQIWADAGVSAGVIGTIETRYAGQSVPMSGTTPDVLELQRIFRSMADAGTERCVMEVSSHALEQGRVKGTRFRTAVFTNLTQDHLDYHGTMEAYEAAKGLFFSRLGNTYSNNPGERNYAVLNADDDATKRFAKLTSAEVLTYGIDNAADIKASEVKITSMGTTFALETFLGNRQVSLRLVGKFNVYNSLAALGVAICEGIGLDDAIRSLERIPGVPGRVEPVDEDQDYAVIVDYAHTPDGLENVLNAVKELAKGEVICVFGCGGDRDKTKRPLMGRIASELADKLIVTSDNPRSEDPLAILQDIEAGLKDAGVAPERYELEPNRRSAIEKAVEMASPGDVVLIAGKGHETYQIIGDVTHDFDDRLVAKEAIRSRNK